VPGSRAARMASSAEASTGRVDVARRSSGTP
jgi:hypothetical protein